jgi:hypothetical protein
LDKPNDDVIFTNYDAKVEQAKYAEKSGKLVSCIYEVFSNDNARNVTRQKFVKFCKFMLKNTTDSQCSDIFMHVSKKLQNILNSMSSPNNSRLDDTLGNNSDIASIVKMGTYGMS